MSIWRLSDRTLTFPPPVGAGIVNVTDDSFFSGARSGTPERAVADGLALVEAGFELLDVGAVAARSGPPVTADEEAAKLVPAVASLAARSGVPVLADTFSAEVAAHVLDAGAAAINDISGGADPAMLGLVAERIEAATAAGVDPEQIAVDPGLDFDLTTDDDLELLRRVGELRELGRPIFMALSRKDFLGAVLAGSWEERVPAEERGAATQAATALAAAAGVEVFRLHDREALDAMRVAAAIADPAAVPSDRGARRAKRRRAAVEAPDVDV